MSDDVALAAAEHREVSEGRLTENRLSHPLAPVLEGRALERYLFLCNNWQQIRESAPSDLPADPHRSKYIRDHLAPAHAGAAAAEAVRNGQSGVLNYLNGLTNKESGMSVVKRLARLQQRIRRDGYMATFAGQTDSGKTNFALLMAELALFDDPDLSLVTNMTSLRNHPSERTHVVECFHDLRYLVENFSGPWFVVLDELSSHASGYAGDRSGVEEYFRPFSRRLAKYSVRLVVIGHQGDIHPVIREFSNDFIYLEREITTSRPDASRDVYEAGIYAGVSDDGREPEDLIFSIPEVPAVGWDYSPDEQCRWSWEESDAKIVQRQ